MEKLFILIILSSLFAPALLNELLPFVNVSVPSETYLNFTCAGGVRLAPSPRDYHLIPPSEPVVQRACECRGEDTPHCNKFAEKIQIKCQQETVSACPPGSQALPVCDFFFFFPASLDTMRITCQEDLQWMSLSAIRGIFKSAVRQLRIILLLTYLLVF